jgi:hypothetical protein
MSRVYVPLMAPFIADAPDFRLFHVKNTGALTLENVT